MLAALFLFSLVSTGEETGGGERDVGGALLVVLHGVSSSTRAVLCLGKRERPELPRTVSFSSWVLCVERWLLLQFSQSPMCVPVNTRKKLEQKKQRKEKKHSFSCITLPNVVFIFVQYPCDKARGIWKYLIYFCSAPHRIFFFRLSSTFFSTPMNKISLNEWTHREMNKTHL